MNSYALYNVNRGCWLYKFDQDQNQATYRNEPTLFYKTAAEIVRLVRKVSDASCDTFTLHQLTTTYCVHKPSLVSEMSKYTTNFSPKVAEFIHNTAIRFGDLREEKLTIAKDLSESLDKAMGESLEAAKTWAGIRGQE